MMDSGVGVALGFIGIHWWCGVAAEFEKRMRMRGWFAQRDVDRGIMV